MRVEDGSAARTLLELSASRNESKDRSLSGEWRHPLCPTCLRTCGTLLPHVSDEDVVADRGYPSVARGATKTLVEARSLATAVDATSILDFRVFQAAGMLSNLQNAAPDPAHGARQGNYAVMLRQVRCVAKARTGRPVGRQLANSSCGRLGYALRFVTRAQLHDLAR